MGAPIGYHEICEGACWFHRDPAVSVSEEDADKNSLRRALATSLRRLAVYRHEHNREGMLFAFLKGTPSLKQGAKT